MIEPSERRCGETFAMQRPSNIWTIIVNTIGISQLQFLC
jgi:hypothetical protein